MKKTFFAKRFVVGFVVVVIGATFGSAFALWTSTGTGSGNAKALSAQNVTVTATTGAADLYPGSTGKVFFTLTNPNPYPISFASMTPGTVTSADPTNCPATNITVGSPTGLSLPVAANATSATLSISNVVTLAAAAPDGCQGVVFTIALTLTGSQV
jgi:hypothetical protein